MKKLNLDNINLDFLDEYKSHEIKDKKDKININLPAYKVLIADDDEEVHKISKLMLKDFEFEGRAIEVLHTYNGKDTAKLCEEQPDIAILFLDVVMESNDSGFRVIRKVREDLNNQLIRIVLRTGEPGQAPEENVVRKYDINDYILKTDLTYKRFNTIIYSSLRNYRDLIRIENHKIGLEKIIKSSSRLFGKKNLSDFLTSILEELSNLNSVNYSMIFARKDITTKDDSIKEKSKSSNGFVSLAQKNKHRIYAATGEYSNYIGKDINELPNHSEIIDMVNNPDLDDEKIHPINSGYIIKNLSKTGISNYIYIEGAPQDFDFSLIKVFLSNYSVALDNFLISNTLKTTQSEILVALAETIDSHFEETGSHVKRVSKMMYNFAIIKGYTQVEADIIALASSVHDIGKVAIPESILMKPGKLTKEEFEVIKTHTIHGHKILNKGDLPTIRVADEIAYNHHEKYDGTGYPNGIEGDKIPKTASMMSIVDVFDALTHERVYKDAISRPEAIDYIESQKGRHFNPDLVDLFVENLDKILEGVEG